MSKIQFTDGGKKVIIIVNGVQISMSYEMYKKTFGFESCDLCKK